MGGRERARALIVDAEPDSREQLRFALGEHVELVGEVSDAADGIPFVAADEVDLIVMSLRGAESLESAQELLEGDPGLALVFLNRRASFDMHELAKLLAGLGSVPRQCRAAPAG